MTLLRYKITRSSRWTKTSLSPPPGRSWHNPSWNTRPVYLGQCPAHLLCPGRWGAQGAMFPLVNRGGGVTIILSLYTINPHNMPRWATPRAKATQRTLLLLDWVQRFMLLNVFSICWCFEIVCNLCVSRDFNVYFQFNISESTWVMGNG